MAMKEDNTLVANDVPREVSVFELRGIFPDAAVISLSHFYGRSVQSLDDTVYTFLCFLHDTYAG